ncbi:MAG TPA: M3 family oligoendopeptidase [Balneolaceae bacterium]|nr:M3 family oligoendopeptidase [Balneolaceae bacterium]
MAIKEKHKTGAEDINWDLSDLYKSTQDPDLKSDKQKLRNMSETFAGTYKGEVSSFDAGRMFKALKEYEEIIELAHKIGSYAHLLWSTNTEDPKLGKLLQEASELGAEISQKLVFFDVEWLNMDDEKANELINDEVLTSYRHYLEVSRLYKKHTLSEQAEQVMSAKSVTSRRAWNRYFDETLGAARFELEGEKLTEQQVLSKLHDSDRDVRRKAHASLTKKFNELSRSLTFIFNTVLADKSANDKLRGYDNWITSRNLSNQIDDRSVDTLIQSVTDSYSLVQRYYRIKKQLLGYEELFDYDRYAPLLETKTKISWNSAADMVLEAYGEFHPDMKHIAGQFFEKKWIDAAIKPGKRGGAYSASTVTSVHPYVFMNYDGQIRDVQTLAHELGHGVHQYLSRKQGELQSGTPLTTAETASVFGEMLVFQKLKNNLDDPEEKLALLIGKIDDTIATVFRQISMNRFEDSIHNRRRSEGELTSEEFSELWFSSQKDLYGDSVTITDEYKIWWCYIPHFLHTPGYVYAYAFGELLVLALYDQYRKGETGFEDKYIELLEAGGSDWPHKLVKKLGVDIQNPNFWKGGLTIFESMIDEAEQLATRISKK